MIQVVIRQYFTEPVTRQKILRDRDRLVAEVEVNGQLYFLKGEKQSNSFVEIMITFAEHMSNAGLPFILPEKAMNGDHYVEYEGLIFILERKGLGEEIEKCTLAYIKEIGKMLGKQHTISSSIDLRFGSGTSWGMFGGNETDTLGDYDENELCYLDLIRCLEESGQFETQELLSIKELYQTRREILRVEWDTLPNGPVQGDFAPYNLLFQQDRVSGVFDYNIAGDEVFINECIANAIYLAWHYDFEGEETPEERYNTYIAAYTFERPLSKREQELIPHLFAIIRSFRYDRVEEGIKKIKNGEGKVFIEETIRLLQG